MNIYDVFFYNVTWIRSIEVISQFVLNSTNKTYDERTTALLFSPALFGHRVSQVNLNQRDSLQRAKTHYQIEMDEIKPLSSIRSFISIREWRMGTEA